MKTSFRASLGGFSWLETCAVSWWRISLPGRQGSELTSPCEGGFPRDDGQDADEQSLALFSDSAMVSTVCVLLLDTDTV